MLEDFENEKPLWKLTCYGHSQYGPCDIVGDISYDELRALAYDDYKHGKSLQAIVQRERNMLNSKITEFENLIQKPYTVSSASTPSSQNLFAGVNKNAPFANTGSSAQVSSFSQLSALLNTRSATAPSYDFGQASAFQSNSQPSSAFQMNTSPFNSSATPFQRRTLMWMVAFGQNLNGSGMLERSQKKRLQISIFARIDRTDLHDTDADHKISSKDCVVDDYLIQSFCRSDDFLDKNCKQETVAEYIAASESGEFVKHIQHYKFSGSI